MDTVSTYMAFITGTFVLAIVGNIVGNSLAWMCLAREQATTALSSAEVATLIYLREEGKLARDIFVSMYRNWGSETFSNSAFSKQIHMDAMKEMLDAYKLPDPIQSHAGVFINPDLKARYDQLLTSGLRSYIDSLYVGATIEENNSLTIRGAIKESTHTDLTKSYRALLDESKKNLDVYIKLLASKGVGYTPRFVSPAMTYGVHSSL